MTIRHIFKDTTKSPLDLELSVTVMVLIFKFNKYHGISHPIFVFLTGKWELNCKCLTLYKNIVFLKYLESKSFATCGEWRMGWITLF